MIEELFSLPSASCWWGCNKSPSTAFMPGQLVQNVWFTFSVGLREVYSAYTRRCCLSVLLVTMIWHCIAFVDSLSLCTLDMSNSCQSLLSKTVHANCSTCHRIASIYRWGERWTKNLYTLLRENGNDLSGIGKNWNVIVYEIAHVIVFVHVRQLYVFAT